MRQLAAVHSPYMQVVCVAPTDRETRRCPIGNAIFLVQATRCGNDER
jgi:hypothetical protein